MKDICKKFYATMPKEKGEYKLMFCRNCGTELPEEAKFCTKCGASTQAEPPAQSFSPSKDTADTFSAPRTAPTGSSSLPGHSTGRKPLVEIAVLIVALVVLLPLVITGIINPGWLILGLIVWIVVRPYVLIATLSRKNRAGIPCGLTAAQIEDMLIRSPWCEEQKIGTENTLIPSTQTNAQLVFEGIRAKVYLNAENGRLHAYSYNLLVVTNFRRSFWAHQEAQMFLRYIVALEQRDTVSAGKIREKNRSTTAKRFGLNNFTVILYCILVVMAIVLFVLKEQGIIIPIDMTKPSASTDEPSDTRSPAGDLPVDGPEDDKAPTGPTASSDAPYLGEYTMASENMFATLKLYYSNGGDIYIDGIANYNAHAGEVFGEIRVVDDNHLSLEEDGNRLDITYDAEAQRLIVEETGTFGGIGVTFAGTYVRNSSEPASENTGPDSAQSGAPSDADVAAALAVIMPAVVAVPGQWSINEYGTVSITPQSAVSGAFTISGSVDIMMVQIDDGSWFAEASENNCTITYNHSGEYYEDAANQRGFVIDSLVEVGGGYASITVTPLDFTYGSDPTGADYTCYLEPYDGEDGAYILSDANSEIGIFLDENIEPCAFSYEF